MRTNIKTIADIQIKSDIILLDDPFECGTIKAYDYPCISENFSNGSAY